MTFISTESHFNTIIHLSLASPSFSLVSVSCCLMAASSLFMAKVLSSTSARVTWPWISLGGDKPMVNVMIARAHCTADLSARSLDSVSRKSIRCLKRLFSVLSRRSSISSSFSLHFMLVYSWINDHWRYTTNMIITISNTNLF